VLPTQANDVPLVPQYDHLSLVRTFVVEDVKELVEASLLLQEVGCSRFGGLFLEREMHAFVTAILLGMTRLDALDADAEAQPPDRQLAQVEQSVCGSEGHAVVAADIGGKAALLKKPSNTVKA
jgi:hypothetical protein